MEETPTPQITATNTPNLFVSSLGRALLTTIITIAALLSLAFASFYFFDSITTLPTLFYRSLSDPFTSLLCTLVYIITTFAIILLSISLSTIAYRLIRRRALTRWHFLTCLVLAILTVVLIAGITPTFSEFASTSAYPHFFPDYLTPHLPRL